LILAATVAVEVATMGIVAVLFSQMPVSAGTSLPMLEVKARQEISDLAARAIHGRPVTTTAVRASVPGQSCLPSEDVLERLETDRDATGGRLVLLSDGLQQSFSDVWRRKAHAETVPVSSIVAHLFPDETGTEWNADVVEFDARGCAMTRTLVPGDVWNALLRVAVGVEV
jgi:hypothetical protein